MEPLQAFLLGIIVAWTPSLILAARLHLPPMLMYTPPAQLES
jgi:hypothetical protein